MLRSPEPSKTSTLGSSEDAIEPVSPPEGMAEPGHPRSAMYPLLYRDGEQTEPRYLCGLPPRPRTLQTRALRPHVASVPTVLLGVGTGLLCSRDPSGLLSRCPSLRELRGSFMCLGLGCLSSGRALVPAPAEDLSNNELNVLDHSGGWGPRTSQVREAWEKLWPGCAPSS